MKTVTKTSTSTAKANTDGSKPGAQANRAGFSSSQRGTLYTSSGISLALIHVTDCHSLNSLP